MAPMLVMGLFGFLGKAVKGVAKGIGAVAKIGVSAAKFGLTSGLLPIPGGGLIGKVAGGLLQAKQPMSQPKIGVLGIAGRALPILLRGKAPMATPRGQVMPSTPRLQQMSPVLPGGAIASPTGPRASSGTPPLTYSGQGSSMRKRKRRSTGRKRSTKKRRAGKRKLKFGSPAWRKKYLGHGRKKRRR